MTQTTHQMCSTIDLKHSLCNDGCSGCDACFSWKPHLAWRGSLGLSQFLKKIPSTCTLNTASCWQVVKPSVKPVTCRAGVVCTVCMHACMLCVCVCVVSLAWQEQKRFCLCAQIQSGDFLFFFFFWQNSCHFLQPPFNNKQLLHPPLLKFYSYQSLLRVRVLHQAACTAGSVECPNNFKHAYSYGQ